MPSDSADCPALPPQQFKRAWRLVTIAGAMGMTYLTCITSAPRVKFLTELGASAFDFGLLASIPSVALAFQILGGVIARRIRRRKALWMGLVIVARMCFLLVLAAPILFVDSRARIWWIIGVLAFHDILGNIGGPMWMSWMGDLAPKESLSRKWALRQRYVVGTGIVAGVLVALFFSHFEKTGQVILGFTILGVVAVVIGVIDICLFAWVPEPAPAPPKRTGVWETVIGPLKDRDFRPFVIFRGYWTFSAALSFPFFGLYLIDYVGVSVRDTQLMSMAGSVGVVLATRFCGLLVDTYGQRPILLMLLCGKGLIPLGFVLAPPVPHFAIPILAFMMFIDGFFNAAFELSNQSVILRTTPRENRAMYVAVNNFLALGVGASLAPLISGAAIESMTGSVWKIGVWAFTGFHIMFLISSLMRFAAILFARHLREPQSATVPVVLKHLTSTNPLRVARWIYRLTDSEKDSVRAQAARRLGDFRSPLAIRDLIAALRDPSRKVRNAAADALGRIGNAEATAPLARALVDPALGIQSPAARALGYIGGFDSLKALLGNLRGLSKPALGETVDSLGRIGDSAAVLPLICLFSDVEDAHLRRRIAAALGRLSATPSPEAIIAMLGESRPVRTVQTSQ